MQAKRFVAADMRRALDMVKEEFGEEAMIVSTERTTRGVEIVASLEASFQSLMDNNDMNGTQGFSNHTTHISPHQQKIANAASRFTSEAMPSVPVKSTNTSVGLASGKTREQLAEEMELANRKMLASRKANEMTLGEMANQPSPQVYQSRQVESPSVSPVAYKQEPITSVVNSNDQEIQRLHTEIAEMRSTIEFQLTQMVENQERQYIESIMPPQIQASSTPSSFGRSPHTDIPIISEIKYQLSVMGLPNACNDHLINSIKDNNMPISNKQVLWTHVLAELAKNISADMSDPISKGGVYSFLGTTGVGKTTTIAKLAARYVMEHGADSVVLVTTDTYRIAAHNQLESLAKILNVKVIVVDDLKALPSTIEACNDRQLVLIDTPGMGYSDSLLKPHLQILKQCSQVKNILVMSANSQYQMMKASLHSYRLAGLDSCILTKLDECANLGDALGVLFDQDINLSYITDGQSVPKDIAVLKSSLLVTRAVNMTKWQRKHHALEQQSI